MAAGRRSARTYMYHACRPQRTYLIGYAPRSRPTKHHSSLSSTSILLRYVGLIPHIIRNPAEPFPAAAHRCASHGNMYCSSSAPRRRRHNVLFLAMIMAPWHKLKPEELSGKVCGALSRLGVRGGHDNVHRCGPRWMGLRSNKPRHRMVASSRNT